MNTFQTNFTDYGVWMLMMQIPFYFVLTENDLVNLRCFTQKQMDAPEREHVYNKKKMHFQLGK